jgi:hypothetical protein
MSLEETHGNIALQLKRIADRLEMIHNHMSKFPESNPKLDEELVEEEEAEEAPKSTKSVKGSKAVNATTAAAKAPSKGVPVSVDEKLTEDDVRIAANGLIKSAIKSAGSKEKGVAEGKKHVKRVLGEFDCEKIEDLQESDYKNAIRAFERVSGTFVPEAEASDDLDI